jgi:hypothetical protein
MAADWGIQMLSPTGAAVPALIESLEPRTFLSTTPEQHNLMSLLGYDRLGSSWKYSSAVTVSADGDTDTQSGSAKVAVAATKVRYDGRDCNAVKFSSGAVTLSTAWYTNSKGTFQTLTATAGDFGTITIKLHDTRVAPRAMVVGQTYTDSGRFDGTFRGSFQGQTVTGSFRGTDSVTSTLWKHQTVRSRAGRFDTVKGSYDVNVSGKLTIRVAGQSVTANVNLTDSSVFWAAPGVGVVKQIDAARLSFSAPSFGAITATADATSTLVSYVLG